MSDKTVTQTIFSSWLEVKDDPTWRQRGLVITVFTFCGVIAAALSTLTPMADFHLANLGYAGLSAALASLPLAGILFSACRDRDLFLVTLFSLALAVLGYFALALQLAVIDAIAPSNFFWEGIPEPRWYDPEHIGVGLFVALGVFLMTWKLYLPCAVITGWAMSFFLSSRAAPDRA